MNRKDPTGDDPIDRFRLRVRSLHDELCIPGDYEDSCRMPLQIEAADLCDAGPDVFGRPQRMTPQTYRHWCAMRDAAAADGVELQLVSAYRSLDYQCELIRRKLARGDPIEEILRVNAAPGYSEHHTGRALDLGTPDCEALSESFEATPAFAWLQRRAAAFGFRMSFPRGNAHGIVYEPWHWAYGA